MEMRRESGEETLAMREELTRNERIIDDPMLPHSLYSLRDEHRSLGVVARRVRSLNSGLKFLKHARLRFS